MSPTRRNTIQVVVGVALMVVMTFTDAIYGQEVSPQERFDALFEPREETDSPMSKITDGRKPRPPDAMLWMTLRELYISKLEVKGVKPEHLSNVVRVLDRFTGLRDLINKRINQISELDIQEYVRHRSLAAWKLPNAKTEPKILSTRTVNNEIAIINSCFAYAGPRLPVKGHRNNLGLMAMPPYYPPLAENEPCPIHVTEAQLEAFIDATKFAKSPQPCVCDPQKFWLCVLVLDSITALRRESLLTVVRPDQHTLTNSRKLHITADLMKNRRAEIITLGRRDDVIELLSSLPSRPGEPLLPWKRPDGRPLSLNHFNREMKRFQKEAGMEDGFALRTKHLRSTAASEIISEEFSTETARKRLGHKSDDVIVRNYLTRNVNQADINASDALAKRVMSLVNSPDRPPTIPMKEIG